MLQFMLDPLGCLEKWRRKFGDPFTLGAKSNQPWVFCGQPDAVKAIYRPAPDTFVEPRGGDKILKAMMGEGSLFRLAGERHREERKMLTPYFHAAGLLRLAPAILEIFESARSQWQPGYEFTVRDFTQQITLRVICRMIFGERKSIRVERIESSFSSFMDYLSPLYRSLALTWWPMRPRVFPNPWRDFYRRLAPVDQLLREEISSHRAYQSQSEASDALVDGMIEHRYSDGSAMSDSTIKDEIMTMLFAGHETTASALAWALYLVISNEAVHEQLIEELDHIPPAIEIKDMLELPYLSAVVSETLRLHPGPIITARVLKKPLEVGGYQLPPGTMVVPCVQLTHHDAAIYPDPWHFDPSRFLTSKFSPAEFWPFGDGHRKCVGAQLATIEMKLALFSILREWNLEPCSKSDPKPVRRGGLIAPSSDMRLRVVSKRSV